MVPFFFVTLRKIKKMLGTIVNTACIITGSLIGGSIKKTINPKYQEVLFNAMGLASLGLGANCFVSSISKSNYPVLFILSLAIGGLLGTILDISGRINRFAEKKGKASLAQGITTTSLLFCIGTFSIVGPMLSALKGDNTFLFTNSTLDFVTSMVFATTYGYGIMWSALILCTWQSTFYLIAKFSESSTIMQNGLVDELVIIGGILIISSGLSILKIKDCKTINLIPAMLIPVIWFLVKSLF